MAKIALGVCSSVSIYKACEVVRGFQKKGHSVQVAMTRNASRLISPLLFSALTGQTTIVDPFEEESIRTVGHVSLAREASLLLVAPATANIIGKFASGVADDFLSTLYLAAHCPVLIAPAMNESMYLHPQTQRNMESLRSLGVDFIVPEKGYLACREEGWGRLADPDRIVGEGLRLIGRSLSLRGKKFLVTAGPTREFLDPVRFLSNPSSGKMGYEIALEALKRGAEVTLISGPTQIRPPAKARVVKVVSAKEMESETQRHFAGADVVIMAAAVSDFQFVGYSRQKIRKEKVPDRLEIVRTNDILETLGRKKKGQVLVGFAAETSGLSANAFRKLSQKNLDLIVANNVLEEGAGFESDSNRVRLIDSRGKTVQTEKLSKREISRVILDRVEAIIGQKG